MPDVLPKMAINGTSEHILGKGISVAGYAFYGRVDF
jgi:hypothetical protein